MVRTLSVLLVILGLAGSALAQPSFDEVFKSADLDVGGGLLSQPEPQVTAALSQAGDIVTLSVRVDLPEGGNTYSQNAEAVKPARPTKFEMREVAGLTAIDPGFTPTQPPKKSFDKAFGKEVEKHYGTVTWTRKYRIAEGADLAAIMVSGKVNLLYCKDSCQPLTLPFKASFRSAVANVDELPAPVELFGDATDAPPPVEELSAPTPASVVTQGDGDLSSGYTVIPQYGQKLHREGDPARISFILDKDVGDGLAVLAIRMELAEGYHVRALTMAPDQDEKLKPTGLEVSEITGLTPVSEGFAPNSAPTLHGVEDGVPTLDHDGGVVWTRVYKLDSSAAAGVKGSLTYTICRSVCLRPMTIEFSLGALQTAESLAAATTAAAPLPLAERRVALSAAQDTTTGGQSGTGARRSAKDVAEVRDGAPKDLSQALWWAFLGGLILNVMPCVLPVLSIKALSFVHQAGERPGRVLMLNVVYSLGVLTVFMALAALALTISLGWGAQNQSASYNIVMAAVVFAMGLSLMGVFEIPIPGMMSSGIGGSQHGEGLFGAYMTGILATTLAVPCTGPFMTTTLFYCIDQPKSVTVMIFSMMGLGMATPYLLIGCFPKLIDWLPRPGNWMVTFKHFCGFAMMGTVVWLLQVVQGISADLIVPTLIILLGLALMLWMVGQLYDLSSTARRRWIVRALSILLAGPVIAYGVRQAQSVVALADEVSKQQVIQVAHEDSNELPWQPFSEARLDELIGDGKPVLIDFTADWCGICKANEFRALNTQATSNFVKEHGFVTLMADFTRESPEIRAWLNRFGQDSVPLTVVIPAGRPDKPKTLRASFSQSDILELLDAAVREGNSVNQGASTANRSENAVSLTR